MKIFNNIILDSISPKNKNDLWLKPIDIDDGLYELKLFTTIKQGNKHIQKWVTIGTGTGNNTTPDTPPVNIEPWYYYKSNEPTNPEQFPDYNTVTKLSITFFLDTVYLFILIRDGYKVKVVSANDEELGYETTSITYLEKNYLLLTIKTDLPLEANITITISKI